MIELRCSNGDRAEAPDPESALLAARTLRADAQDGIQHAEPLTVSFYVDGRHVRTLRAASL